MESEGDSLQHSSEFSVACESPSAQQPSTNSPTLEGERLERDVICVGVDFGSSKSVVATAHPSAPRRAHVEVNRLSNRSTPSTFAFDGKLRTVGEEAESRGGSTGSGSIFANYLQLWFSVRSEADVEALRTRLPFLRETDLRMENGSVVVPLQLRDRIVSAPFSWVLGYYISVLVGFALPRKNVEFERSASEDARLVVTLPSGFRLEADGQKLVDQLLIAGRAFRLPSLRLLRRDEALLNAWGASHLPRGFAALKEISEKQGCAQEEDSSVFLAIVDVGFAETSVQIVQVSEQEEREGEAGESRCRLRLLAARADGRLGVSDAITALASHVSVEIEKKFKQKVESHSRKAARLFAACSRAVVHLSGLTESSVDIEGFLEDEEDLHVPLTRDLFEETCAPIKAKLEALLEETLRQSGKPPSAICAVEVAGGGSRIPWVASTVDRVFSAGASGEVPSKLRRTLDGASAVAMGAASFAAGLRFVEDPLTELQNTCDFSQVTAVQSLEREVALVEAAELRRLEKRNALESFLLEMQGALRGSKASLLGGAGGPVYRHLEEKEHWLLDNQDASEEAFEAAHKELDAYLHDEYAAYFTALQEEKKSQEEALEKGALEAAAVAAASGGRDDADVKLPPSQCLKRAKKNKEEGNELFKDGNTEHAAQRYVKSLQYLSKLYDLPPADKEESDALKLSLNLNLAQCYLRLAGTDASSPTFETFNKKTISCCDAALSIDSQNLKALYRRAIARERMRETEAAMNDVQTALSIAPEETEFLKVRDRLELRQRKEKEQQKKKLRFESRCVQNSLFANPLAECTDALTRSSLASLEKGREEK